MTYDVCSTSHTRSTTSTFNFAPEEIQAMDAEDWQDAADMSGPYMPLAELDLFLDNADPEVQDCTMFHFLDGVRFGRLAEREESSRAY
jgi:hypothetical protein